MLVDLIVRGNFFSINLSFIDTLIESCSAMYFVYPEFGEDIFPSEPISIIKGHDYVDFVINTSFLHIGPNPVPNVFINVGRDNDSFEILFFFDVNDIYGISEMDRFEKVRKWVEEFKQKYNFTYFTCQIDGEGDDDYFFNSNGIGPLYSDIGSNLY